MKLALTALAILAGLTPAPARAETIYRCGHEYTSVACPDAQAPVVAGALTAEQRADSREVGAA